VARFPRIVELVPRDERAYAALPLRANGMSLGVLGISFAERHDFTEADRDFLLALADICAVHLQQWSKLLREPDGTVTTLDEARGAVLGFGAGDRPERMVTFGPGSILVLFTDGLVERRGEIIDTGSPGSARHSRPQLRLAPSIYAMLSSSNHFRIMAAMTTRPSFARSSPNAASCP